MYVLINDYQTVLAVSKFNLEWTDSRENRTALSTKIFNIRFQNFKNLTNHATIMRSVHVFL